MGIKSSACEPHRIRNEINCSEKTSRTNSQVYKNAMAGLLTILIGTLLLAAQSTTGLPTGDEELPAHVQQKRFTPPEAEYVVEGLIYAQNTMLSCYQPSILPEVSGINKLNCSVPGISKAYEKLIDALDKVLRLYDLQQQLMDSSDSVETAALQIIIDTVVNQTCDWVSSYTG